MNVNMLSRRLQKKGYQVVTEYFLRISSKRLHLSGFDGE
jgi:hypothetical protein